MFDDESEKPETLITVADLPESLTIAAIDQEGRYLETAQIDLEASVEDLKASLQDALDFLSEHEHSCRFEIRG